MIRLLKKNIIIFIILSILSSCSSVPSNTKNSCQIFSERYLWYKHAKKAEEKWGSPIHIQLAFIKKESGFNWLAKPKRLKLFKVVPYKRPSSSFARRKQRSATAISTTGSSWACTTRPAFSIRVRISGLSPATSGS